MSVEEELFDNSARSPVPVLVPHLVPPTTTGGPLIWVLPQSEQQEEPQFVRRFSSTNTLSVRRMLIRPISIFVFGVCVLQTWRVARVQQQQHQRMPHSSDSDDITTNTPCASMDWKETETASFWSNNLWSNRNRVKQQLPPYPGGWGKHPAPPSPPPEPPKDNPQLYGWEPTLYPDPLVDPVRCGVAYLPQQTTTTPSEDVSSSSDPPPPPPMPSENETTAAQADPNNNNSNNNEESLRLCDPDWVLGGMYLEEIALALSNFSTLYGDWTTIHANYWTRQLQSQLRSRSRRRLDLNGPSSSPEDQHVSIEAAASENGAGSSPNKKSTVPAIELAVATVRKVCVVSKMTMEGFSSDLQVLTKLY
jgi:hypothetical protein